MRHFVECDLGYGPLLGEGRPFWCSDPESPDFHGISARLQPHVLFTDLTRALPRLALVADRTCFCRLGP